ncbi:MAG: hypothetical protein K8L99_24480 [Anaerolineae bacterium]|nr:hypothetical protein [Anaerolineae bacterium]
MNAQAKPTGSSSEFDQLMRHGRTAYERGDLTLAHNMWKEAALLNPYSEEVWLALLDVLDAPEDQRVCLENILSINPMNVQARRMLRAYEEKQQQRVESRVKKQSEAKRRARERRRARWALVRRALLLGVLIGVTGIVFAIVLSILIYG